MALVRRGGAAGRAEPKDNDDARIAAWEFTWTAPALPGRYRLDAC